MQSAGVQLGAVDATSCRDLLGFGVDYVGDRHRTFIISSSAEVAEVVPENPGFWVSGESSLACSSALPRIDRLIFDGVVRPRLCAAKIVLEALIGLESRWGGSVDCVQESAKCRPVAGDGGPPVGFDDVKLARIAEEDVEGLGVGAEKYVRRGWLAWLDL
jgi:hypothetical protein